MMLDLTSLENAVVQLEESLELYHSDISSNHPRLKRHLRAAVIQAFEFTYELSFKMLKRYLELTSANPSEINNLSFKNIIREGYKQGLLRSELSVWSKFRQNRGTTSHTYNEVKAVDVFEGTQEFLFEAQDFLSRLHERIESLE